MKNKQRKTKKKKQGKGDHQKTNKSTRKKNITPQKQTYVVPRSIPMVVPSESESESSAMVNMDRERPTKRQDNMKYFIIFIVLDRCRE